MDLNDAEALANELMAENLLRPHEWTLVWDNSVNRFGQCQQPRRRISLSRKLTQAGSEAQVRDTVLHEIAHANVGVVEGHNATWKREAIRLGANPSAASDDTSNLRAAAPWVGRCAAGHESKTRFWRKPRNRRSCPSCSPGRFNEQYLITYTKEES